MEEDTPPARVTYGLVVFNVVLFILALVWQQRHGGDSWFELSSSTLLRAGAAVSLDWGVGDAWRMWSSIFLHLSWIHLGLNMYCLARLDALESALGWRRFAVLYGVSGLGGSLLSSAVDQKFLLSAGASGAIFGLFGAMAVVARGRLRRSLILTILANAAYGWSDEVVNNWAHFGGLLAGLAGILYLRRRPESPLYSLILLLFASLTVWSVGRVLVPKGWESYPTKNYPMLGGRIEFRLPIFFKRMAGPNGDYLQSPDIAIACTAGANAVFRCQADPSRWSILPAFPTQPQLRCAAIECGHRYWRLDVWAEQPQEVLQKVIVQTKLDAAETQLAELSLRFQQGKVSSLDLPRPESWGELMLLAEAQIKEKHPRAAEDTALVAFKASQGTDEKAASLGMEIRAMEEQEHWEEALGPSRQLIEIDPKSGQAYNWLAWTLVHTKDYQEAKVQAEHALELSPDQPHILDTYAAALMGLGEMQKALAIMQKAEKLDTTQAGYISKRLGEIYLALGDRELGRASLRRSLKQTLPEKDRQQVMKLLGAKK